jgi:hypothetical protein
MSTAIFVHDEMLNPALPIFTEYPDALRVFVFDDEFLRAERWTIKRIQFIADGLMEMPNIRVFKGSAQDVLRSLDVVRVITQQTPNSNINRMLDAIDALNNVEVTRVSEPPFADYNGSLARFSRYWNGVEKQLFR